MNNPNHDIFSQYWDSFFQFLKKGQGDLAIFSIQSKFKCQAENVEYL